jgi:KDO2-lipid IV(A) lauroyltransferase
MAAFERCYKPNFSLPLLPRFQLIVCPYMKYRPKHIVEYVALRSFAFLFEVLPKRVALRLGEGLAAIAFYVCRFRRSIAEDRIRSVFGDRYSAKEVSRIAWRSWRNVGLNAVEMIRARRMTRDAVLGYYDSGDLHNKFNDELKKGRGLVIAVPHTGNWEFSALVGYYAGIPVFSFAATQRNPLVNHYMNALRKGPGIPTIQRDSGSLRDVIRRLRENQALAILPDVRMRTPGLQIPFLGGTANIGPGMASFARQTGSPLVLCVPRRKKLCDLSVELRTTIYPDASLPKSEDIERMTREILGHVDAIIREEPEQWFWFNKRWILDPLDA